MLRACHAWRATDRNARPPTLPRHMPHRRPVPRAPVRREWWEGRKWRGEERRAGAPIGRVGRGAGRRGRADCAGTEPTAAAAAAAARKKGAAAPVTAFVWSCSGFLPWRSVPGVWPMLLRLPSAGPCAPDPATRASFASVTGAEHTTPEKCGAAVRLWRGGTGSHRGLRGPWGRCGDAARRATAGRRGRPVRSVSPVSSVGRIRRRDAAVGAGDRESADACGDAGVRACPRRGRRGAAGAGAGGHGASGRIRATTFPKITRAERHRRFPRCKYRPP